MFDIKNSRDFYVKLLADFDDLMENQDSTRHAMNCAITAHHMHDWIWNDYLKTDETTRRKMGISKDKNDFIKWVDAKSVWFGMVQELSNGSKHFGRRSSLETRRVAGYGMGGYGLGPYGHSYLEVDLGEGAGECRLMTVADLLEVVVRFWRDFLRHYSPYGSDLPRGKTKLMDEQ